MSLDLSAPSRNYNRPERLKEILKIKIGFSVESDENLPETPAVTLPVSAIPAAVRSLVQVRFEDDGRVLTYFDTPHG